MESFIRISVLYFLVVSQIPESIGSDQLTSASNELKSLTEENQRLKDEKMCKICFIDEISVVFMPCGHMVSCAQCAFAFPQCPVCRLKIDQIIKPFLA